MAEWSSSEEGGVRNVILSIISPFSETNITPSFENYELLTGFHCRFLEAVSADMHRVQRLKWYRASLPPPHTPHQRNTKQDTKPNTYVAGPHHTTLQHTLNHYSPLVIFNQSAFWKNGQSAALIAPVSTVTLFVQPVGVCVPTQYFYAECVFLSLGNVSHT